MLGGRTNHYGRISLRMGPYDFKPYSRDGKGFDWPITYDDLAPYYDKAEELIGVFGTQEGLENTPDGKFQPAPAPRGYERVIKMACDKLKHSLYPSRLAILTQSIERPCRLPLLRAMRALVRRECQLQFAGRAHLPGYEDRQPGSPHRRHGAGGAGWVRTAQHAASLISTRRRGRKWTVRAKIVVLAASCCETARIMLNSKSSAVSERHREFDRAWSAATSWIRSAPSVSGYLPIMEDLPPQNEDGVGGMHMYMPWWKYKEQKANKMPFARGYHIEFGGGRGLPGAGELYGGSDRESGRRLRRRAEANLRKIYGADVYFAGRGEMIPNEDSYCEIDPNVVDQWGIPVLRFHFKWSQDEILQAKHMQETFQQIIETVRRQGDSQGRRRTATGASRAAAKSFTKSAPPRWATTPRPRCSISTARRGTARICSSPMPRRSSAMRIRIPR